MLYVDRIDSTESGRMLCNVSVSSNELVVCHEEVEYFSGFRGSRFSASGNVWWESWDWLWGGVWCLVLMCLLILWVRK